MYRRNKINLVRSYYLWLQYYVSALSVANDFETYLISYEDLVQDPYLEMKRLGKSLGLQFNTDIDTQLKIFAKNYVNPSLQHHKNSIEFIDYQKAIPIEVKQLYINFLKANAEKLSQKDLIETSKKIRQRLTEVDPLLTMIDKIEGIGESKKYRFFAIIEELNTE